LICTSDSSSSTSLEAGAGLDGSGLISGSSTSANGESSLTAREADRVRERDGRLRFEGVVGASTGKAGGGLGGRRVCVFC
jgi:hypothetical protein